MAGREKGIAVIKQAARECAAKRQRRRNEDV